MRKKLILAAVGIIVIGLAIAVISIRLRIQSQNEELRKISGAVEHVLSSPPAGGYAAIPKGVRLLSASRDGNYIVLDFSQELLLNGTGAGLEDAIHQILSAASSASVSNTGPVLEYRILIIGRPLQLYLK